MEIHVRYIGKRRVSLEVWDTTYVLVIVEDDGLVSFEAQEDLKSALFAYRWAK